MSAVHFAAAVSAWISVALAVAGEVRAGAVLVRPTIDANSAIATSVVRKVDRLRGRSDDVLSCKSNHFPALHLKSCPAGAGGWALVPKDQNPAYRSTTRQWRFRRRR